MVLIPDNLKYRLYLSYEEGVYRKFLWFQMRGGDFYWGASHEQSHVNVGLQRDGNTGIITIPDDFSTLPKIEGKYSYHKDGQIHFKKTIKNERSEYSVHSLWPLKTEIDRPVMFSCMITKALKHYDSLEPNPTKKYSQVLQFKIENAENTRLYMEFFLAPEGNHKMKEFWFPGLQTKFVFHSMNQNLILGIRYGPLGVGYYPQHSDKSFTFLPDGLLFPE